MQEWKASEKEAQKMTRDGAISVNLVTGEATHISDRPQEQDYSSADETAGTLSRAVDEVEGHVERRQAKKARRKRRDTFREGEAARDRPSSRSGRVRRPGTALPPVCSFRRQTGRRRS